MLFNVTAPVADLRLNVVRVHTCRPSPRDMRMPQRVQRAILQRCVNVAAARAAMAALYKGEAASAARHAAKARADEEEEDEEEEDEDLAAKAKAAQAALDNAEAAWAALDNAEAVERLLRRRMRVAKAAARAAETALDKAQAALAKARAKTRK